MVLNATSVGVGRRNRSFLCMCSRNCIFDIIIIIISINIVFVVVVLMLQNRQVMVTSFGCCWYSGAIPSRSGLRAGTIHKEVSVLKAKFCKIIKLKLK